MAKTTKTNITLDCEQIVVALQALRQYGDQLETALRHRRAWDQRLRAEQEHNNALLERFSEAYIKMKL